MKKNFSLFNVPFLLIVLFCNQSSNAKEFPAQGRLFAGYQQIAPSNINADLVFAGLKSVDALYHGGVEITYPLHPLLNVGLRYSHRLAYAEENPSTSATNFFGGIRQDVMLGVLRINAIKSKIFRLDGFAGIGAGNSRFVIKTADQDGTLSAASALDWFASPIYGGGISAGVGFDKFFLYVEGVYEKNDVTRLQKVGSQQFSHKYCPQWDICCHRAHV